MHWIIESRTRPAAQRSARYALFLGILFTALVVAPPAFAQDSVTLQLTPAEGSNVSGSVTLNASGDATNIALDISGLTPGAAAQASLNAGTCREPSASFVAIPLPAADANGRVTATAQVLYQGAEDIAFAVLADGDHIIAISSGGRVVACSAIPAATANDLRSLALSEGQRNQLMEFNPAAALQRRIFEDGFVPNSDEFAIILDATSFTGQRAEHLGTGTVRVYFARTGDWNNVRYYQRGSGFDPLGQALLVEAERRQEIQFNPAAALQKRIFANGYVPNSGEFQVSVNGIGYTAQRAEHLRTGRVRIYYARNGDWANVQVLERPAV